MAIVERPNQEALSRAIDTYLDAIRPFLTHNLKQVSGLSVEGAIVQSLPKGMDEEFAQCLEKTDCTESAIEVSYVKHVMDQHWEGVFAPHFRSRAETLRELDRVRYARNQVAHPAYRQDLDGIETSRFLDSVITLLCAIGARDECEAVANIKAELESPGVQNRNAIREFGRLEAQFDKIVVELEETRGFLWKVESELDYTKGNLKEEESARRNAEKVAQVAEHSNCRLTDELQSEVAAKRDAEQMTDQVEKRLMRTESDLDSMNGNLKKEKAARKRADKRSQDAQASLSQVNEELKMAAVARREAEESAQEESRGRQLAEQTALTLQTTLEQTEKELSSIKGELKRAQEQKRATELARQEDVYIRQLVLNGEPFDPRTTQYELWLIDEILSGRLDRAALRQLAGDSRLSGRLVYFVQAASSEMDGAQWQGYVAGRQRALLRNGKGMTSMASRQRRHLDGAPQH